MKRQVTDDGHWFDLDAAEHFEESTFWDGRNRCSRVTGSQWEHETLYRTRGGRWVLNRSSQWEGARDSWVEIDDDAAALWFMRNGDTPHPACEAEYDAREI